MLRRRMRAQCGMQAGKVAKGRQDATVRSAGVPDGVPKSGKTNGRALLLKMVRGNRLQELKCAQVCRRLRKAGDGSGATGVLTPGDSRSKGPQRYGGSDATTCFHSEVRELTRYTAKKGGGEGQPLTSLGPCSCGPVLRRKALMSDADFTALQGRVSALR